MSIKRYNADRIVALVECPQNGAVVRYDDHCKEVERLQKIIDEQSVDIKNYKKANTQPRDNVNRLKPEDDDKFLVSYKISNYPIKDTISYKNLQSYLNLLSINENYKDLTVCALRPVKVVEKKSLTVEL